MTTRADEERAAADERAILDLMARGGTHRDVVRIVMPDATDEVCDHVLWEMTPFPLVQGLALMPYLRQVVSGDHPDVCSNGQCWKQRGHLGDHEPPTATSEYRQKP